MGKELFGIRGSLVYSEEIIKILKDFGGQNVYKLTASHEEFIYYIDQLSLNSAIKEIKPPFGGKVYDYTEFMSLIDYRKDSFVKRPGLPALYKILQLKWKDEEVFYRISDEWFSSSELIPTNESSDIVENSSENFLYHEGEWVTVTENGAQVCVGNIHEFLIDKIVTDPVTQISKYLVNGKLYPARQISRVHPKLIKEKVSKENNENFKKGWSSKEIFYEIPKDYEFSRIEDGKIVLKPALPEIPDTYEKCCKIIGISPINLYTGLNTGVELSYIMKMNILNQLFICRDAFWKILTPEPWKPEEGTTVFDENQVSLSITNSIIFRFPTSWHSDKFYEIFKPLIDKLKNWE